MITLVIAENNTKDIVELLGTIPNAQIADYEYVKRVTEQYHNNIIESNPIIIPPELTDRNKYEVPSKNRAALIQLLMLSRRYNYNIFIVTNNINRLDWRVKFLFQITDKKSY
jgi:hypothetical protein